jgi:hypothetical protein
MADPGRGGRGAPASADRFSGPDAPAADPDGSDAPLLPKLPADVVKLAETARDNIVNGTLHPFTGPIKCQDGRLWLKQGEQASDKDLLAINFYVEGLDGALPK